MKFTQKLKMHLNGGSKFSVLVRNVYANGQLTGITRHTKTSGRPKFLITEDFFQCGDQVFDVMATRGVGMKEWLEKMVTNPPPLPPDTKTDTDESAQGS